MFRRKFERFLKEVIRGKREGTISSLVKMILLPLSWGYRLGVKFRNGLYDLGLMRRYVPPIPLVISVGNIVAGGTGKTPVTLLIANAFYERHPIAILSRGYKSKAEKLDTPIILCRGSGPIYPASYGGDEPYLFARRLPKSTVIVNADRKKASILAEKAGAQIVILDDALQHRSLARDFEVIVVDAVDPFGLGYFLPRGFLRDEIKSLSRADLIVLTHVESLEQVDSIKRQMKAYSPAPIVCTREHVVSIKDLKGCEIHLPEKTPIGMFCAIAQPEYFRKTLEREGFEIVNEYMLPDHDSISDKELENFAQASQKKGAQWIACTEKDRVKLHDYLSLSIPVFWVQIDLELVDGHEEWHHFINEAESKI